MLALGTGFIQISGGGVWTFYVVETLGTNSTTPVNPEWTVSKGLIVVPATQRFIRDEKK